MLVYLASPYSHPDPKIKEKRLSLVNRIACSLMQGGTHVYSPLTHNIPLIRLGIPGTWTAWKKYDLSMLSRCDRLVVLMLPGWEESVGVADEIHHAKEHHIPIEYKDIDESQYAPEVSSPHSALVERMLSFYKEREWEQFHSPKNIAMNLGVEVGELMEHFRWLTEEQSFVQEKLALSEIRDEIGDVFIVLLHLSHLLGIDPIEAAHDKLTKAADKYPVEKCKGLCLKYTAYTEPENND